LSLTQELGKRGRFAKVSHEFQSVGKRYTPSWSALRVLEFKCVNSEQAIEKTLQKFTHDL